MAHGCQIKSLQICAAKTRHGRALRRGGVLREQAPVRRKLAHARAFVHGHPVVALDIHRPAIRPSAIPAVAELGANALIGGAATAGQAVGIPFAATFGVGTLAKEAIKSASSRRKQVKIAKEAVEDVLRQEHNIPFKVNQRTIGVFEKYVGGDTEATKKKLNAIKKLHPNITEGEVENLLSDGVPLSRKI